MQTVLEVSRRAHANLDPQTAGELREAIFDLITEQPRTTHACAEVLGLDTGRVSKRVGDLVRYGCITKGDVVKNPTGQSAHLLLPTPEGRTWRHTGNTPDRVLSKRDLELAVIGEARKVADQHPDLHAALMRLEKP